MSKRYNTAFTKNRLLSGFVAITNPRQNPFLVTKDIRYYWKKKILVKNYKCGKQGGARKFKFTKDESTALNFLIRKKLLAQPQASFNDIISYVKRFNYDINKPYLTRLLKKWRWSSKLSSEEQIQKYSISNIEYYADYLLEISSIPWYKLKFLDESHFRASGKWLLAFFGLIWSDLNFRASYPPTLVSSWPGIDRDSQGTPWYGLFSHHYDFFGLCWKSDFGWSTL